MQQLTVNTSQRVNAAQEMGQKSTDGLQSLEDTIGVAMVGDLDNQIATMSQTMKQNLKEKQEIRKQTNIIQTIELQAPDASSTPEDTYYKIDSQTAESLKTMSQGKFDLGTPDANGNYIVHKEPLDALLDSKNQEMASLNSDSEINYLQIQGLMDQRKTAFTLLSNLMAAENEITAAIVRNIKI